MITDTAESLKWRVVERFYLAWNNFQSVHDRYEQIVHDYVDKLGVPREKIRLDPSWMIFCDIQAGMTCGTRKATTFSPSEGKAPPRKMTPPLTLPKPPSISADGTQGQRNAPESTLTSPEYQSRTVFLKEWF